MNILEYSSKIDGYILIPNFEFEKKNDKLFIFSTKNETKKLINRYIDR
jgi:hypothetical protein